jgi:hypothetical protein
MSQTLRLSVTCDECGATVVDRAIDADNREVDELLDKAFCSARVHDRSACARALRLGNEDLLDAA